ncbi:MAG: cupredoxin domain-containing protein [Terriglobia bacterium]
MTFERRRLIFLLGLITLLMVFALGSSFTQEQPSTRAEKDKNEKSPAVQVIHIVAERFSFTPSRIKVKQGTRVEILLTSEDTFHGFRISSANINQVIPARGRGSARVFFEAKEKGSYPFECSRPCGAGHTMMRGVIIVE